MLSARLQCRCTTRCTVARAVITGLMEGRWYDNVMTQRSTIGSCAAKSIDEAQCALDLVNRKMKNEQKRKTEAKRVKEAFDRLAREDTSAQAEDK
jgi:hypothetical protein